MSKEKIQRGKVPHTVLGEIKLHANSRERIGYQTQKPEELLRIVISSTCPRNGVIADFFLGGGTTCVVAEKLGRRWIGCDISRIAISVARDRIANIYTTDAGIKREVEEPYRAFCVEYHGAYERDVVRNLPPKKYIDFILQCYGAIPKAIGDLIHGVKDNWMVHVLPAKNKVTVRLVDEFAEELQHHKHDNGIILSWGPPPKEVNARVNELRGGAKGTNIQIIQIKLVDIDSHEFKEDNIRFLNKPVAVIHCRKVSGLTYQFDATASQGRNGTDIHLYQWDFSGNGYFCPSTKPNFGQDKDSDGNPLNDDRRTEYTFPESGTYKVGLRIIDKSGAEEIWHEKFEISEKEEAA